VLLLNLQHRWCSQHCICRNHRMLHLVRQHLAAAWVLCRWRYARHDLHLACFTCWLA
jgi:hypothetical protein